MKLDVEGALVAIPAGEAVGLAKVIFRSTYFRDVICLKIYRKRTDSAKQITPSDFFGEFDLCYTNLDGFKNKRWTVLDREPVSADEKLLTRRTAGGEVWIEGAHVGAATDAELAALPKMLVRGCGLIEKHVRNFPVLPF